MKLSDFDYHLPEKLIAQKPVDKRDESRLMVLHRDDGRIEHRFFYNVADYLRKGDALILNRTRVLPARLLGFRKGTGGKMEFLLLREKGENIWEVMAKPGRRAAPGAVFEFGGGEMEAEVLCSTPEGNRIVRFFPKGSFMDTLCKVGRTPLPPYITAYKGEDERYQTVYSREEGSAAAPTAGLHFTPELLEKIRGIGVKIITVLLHVGLGTFQPVKTENIESHKLHSEYCLLTEETAQAINGARRAGGRIICVGTTSCRTLETAVGSEGVIHPYEGETDIFIRPGYQFRATDALITNFHLPRSSLLMLVCALAGRERIFAAYREAVEKEYRFFSFGDAMLII
ncbi:MAG: tRNA preQ1(34) S-adenosylmethionine ribosyltransferase-isomerase QueA [Bacillota bacterium]|nr:tRNA preQ1(34) S-adenosylmethionine ribosyltransferase-isomerase QueA [Bacillota bacterium]